MGPTVSVSVVFTDLVGSTELSSRVGPDVSEELRQVHFGLLRAAIAAAGGTEVKNLGDGLMVVFPSVGSALDGAVAMQQGMERHNRRAAEQLWVRIGVGTGDAVAEDGDYFGETVVQAARLCAIAGGGEILVTEVVALLARSSGHRFEAAGDKALKGLPEPVRTLRLLLPPGPAGSGVPLPERLASIISAGSPFVGRATEVELIDEAFAAAAAGEARTVLLSGEPGVGKTALVAEFTRSAHEAGAAVLYGRCDEELAVPYQPWVEALGHLVEHSPDAVLRAHVAAHGMQLSRLVPQLLDRTGGAAPPATDPETERYLMFQSVCSILQATASESPMVVVLDDLHWSDAPTLALLRHVVSAPMSTPPLVLATYRDTDIDRGHPLVDTVATLRRLPGLMRLVLHGLDPAGVAALLEARSRQTLTEEGVEFAQALQQETNGNPFFTREILRNLAERGELVRNDEGRWGPSTPIDPTQLPESVLEVVGQRVGRLGPDVHRVLTAASVIGRDFDLMLLARVLGDPEEAVLDHLERAVAASMVEEVGGVDDRFTFMHALGQHALQSALSAARRRRLHRRVAEAIESLWPDDPGERVGELARHWLAAVAPVDAERAVRAACLAGQRAMEALAPDEALRWFGEALELIDERPGAFGALRCRLLVAMGTAQRQAGVPAYRETLLRAAELARQVGDTEALVDAALSNNRGYHSNSGATDHEKVAVLEDALAAVGDDDSVERALLLATLCAECNYDRSRPELEELASEALAMARRLGDPRTISEVTSRTRVAVYFLETIGDRFELYAESRRLADEVADPVVCFHAAQALLWAGAAQADMGTFDEQLATMQSIAVRTGQPILRWMTRYTEAMRAAIAGEVDRSEELANEAFEIGTESGQPDAETFYGGQILRVSAMRGQLAGLVDLVAVAAQDSHFPIFRAVLAAALAQRGDTADATALLTDEMERGFDGLHEMQWPTAMTMWTDAAVRLQRPDVAAELYPLLVPFESLTGFTGLTYDGPLGHYAGQLALLLDDLDAAAGHFERALEAERRSGDVHTLALTRLGRGRLHLERAGRLDDDPREVQLGCEEILGAQELARRRGFNLIERDAAEVLGSIGRR